MIEYLLGLISPLIQLLDSRQEKLAQKSEVLSALKAALRSTKKHISETRNEFDDVESKELSDKWSLAAKLIRPFDEHIARVFEEKSDYWTDPNGFKSEIKNEQRRSNYRINIEEVEKAIAHIENNWKKI